MEIIHWNCWETKLYHNHLTGYFRDGKSRIDLIIVAAETSSQEIEEIKVNFLINARNAGFLLELESGVKERNKHLTFIKIHTPDRLLKHFSFIFDKRKFFLRNHLDLAKRRFSDEINLVKMVRKTQPSPLFTTHDRSMITYWILHAMPFGTPENFVGIHRMLHNNIFVDVYPLHDGPHYLIPKQLTHKVNGRQVLFYKWSGYENIFKRQPIHLLREYFGERVAFLFEFYEFYMRTIAVPAVIGAIIFAVNLIVKKDKLRAAKKRPFEHVRALVVRSQESFGSREIVNLSFALGMVFHKRAVCPRCADFVACPYKRLYSYRREIEMKIWIENNYSFILMFIMFIWGLLFYIYWRRRENYYTLLWEVNDDEHRRMRRASNTRAFFEDKNKISTKILKITLEILLLVLLLLFYLFVFLPLLLTFEMKILNRMRYIAHAAKGQFTHTYGHTAIAITAGINGIFIVILERLYQYAAKLVTQFSNPDTEARFESSLVIKMFGFSFLLNFGYIGFYAYIKGALYTTPVDQSRWNLPLGLGMMHCGILSCIDEIFIAFIGTYKAKRYFRLILQLLENKSVLRDLPYKHETRDADVPCWEREYDLVPVDNDFIHHKYNYIMLDIIEATFFLPLFTAAPFLSLLLNVWEIRQWAKFMVLKARRPLMLHQWGLGSWNYILFLIPYGMALSTAIVFVRTTNYLDATLFDTHFKNFTKSSFYLDYYTTYMDMAEYFGNYETQNIKFNSDLKRYVADYNTEFHGQIMYQTYFHFTMSYLTNFTGSPINTTTPFFCIFPGSYVFDIELFKMADFDKLQPRHTKNYFTKRMFRNFTRQKLNTLRAGPAHWYILWKKAMIVLFVQIIVVSLGLILHFNIKEKTFEVESTRDVERSIRTYNIRREMTKVAGIMASKQEEGTDPKSPTPSEGELSNADDELGRKTR